MYCANCGKEIEEGQHFCKVCGKEVCVDSQGCEQEISAYNRSSAQETLKNCQSDVQELSVITPKKPDLAREIKMLVFGIVSLALGGVGGIVFGSITKHMARDAMNEGYVLEGKAKVGHILAQIGFIVGIVSAIVATVAVIVYICFVFFAVWTHSYVETFAYPFY